VRNELADSEEGKRKHSEEKKDSQALQAIPSKHFGKKKRPGTKNGYEVARK